jgi:YD repeat-containing protein
VVNDTNAGTFTTIFGYDGLDRVLTTINPTGEVVT